MTNETAPAAAGVPNESGTLRLTDSRIEYTSRNYGSFVGRLSDVALIGEFTTDNGPLIDDWFLVFVFRSGEWSGASMYADGIDTFREQLSVAFNSPILGQLWGSTDFDSRILWPPSLAGQPLFIFDPVAGSGVFRRLKLWLLPEVSHRLSPGALAELGPDADAKT